MKFSYGAWQWRPEVTPHLVRRVHEARVDDTSISLGAVDRYGGEGIDRVEGLVLQVSVTSPMADVLRVQVRHHHPAERGATCFEVADPGGDLDIRTNEDADGVSLRTGRLGVRFSRSQWDMRLLADGSPLTGGGHDALGYMLVDGAGPFVSQRLDMQVGETIYGMGERFGPLVRNGQSVAIWNEDGGTVSELAYKNIPFYISTAGYGLLVNSPGKVEFEVGTERVSQIQFAAPGEVLDYYVIYGPEPMAILEKYTTLTGRATVPPAWSFGLWLSTSFTTRYDEDTVNEFVTGMAERDIPLCVFHFDCFWMKERHWCNFQWDEQAFPDPRGMLARLRSRGLRTSVWINPYISQLSELFEEGHDRGYFLKRSDGSVYQVDGWQCGMAFVDFTNPAAVRWYQSKLRALLEMGVDCFKTDFGERIPDDAVYHDGADPKLMHNYYAYLYNRAVFELLEDFHGEGEALVFARSATAGCQKFPVHWGGDCEATFESMAEDLRGGLSFCMSGPAYWSHDIGGFTGTADPAVFKRWIAFGLMSTHSRLHGSGSYRVPWLFDEEAVDVMRRFTVLKNQLFPYIYSAAHDAAERGWPVLRAMPLAFPNDLTCRALDRQYMLGGALLVAPVFSADTAEYYLPRGRWTDLLTGRAEQGERWVREPMDFMHLPVFVKEHTLLPLSEDGSAPAWALDEPMTLHLYEPREGEAVRATAVSHDAGAERATFEATRRGRRLEFESNGAATCVTVALHNQGDVAELANGEAVESAGRTVRIRWIDPAAPLSIVLSPSNGSAGNGKSVAAARPVRERA